MKKINIGCGTDIKKSTKLVHWVNLDRHKENGADYIWDLNKLPLPFKDNTFDEVYCSHVIEDFAEPNLLLDEFTRILRVGGIMEIRVPYENSAWNNMRHKTAFNFWSFENYINEESYGKKKNLTICLSILYGYKGVNSTFFSDLYQKFACFMYNALPHNIVDYTCIKYLFPIVSIKIIIMKNG